MPKKFCLFNLSFDYIEWTSWTYSTHITSRFNIGEAFTQKDMFQEGILFTMCMYNLNYILQQQLKPGYWVLYTENINNRERERARQVVHLYTICFLLKLKNAFDVSINSNYSGHLFVALVSMTSYCNIFYLVLQKRKVKFCKAGLRFLGYTVVTRMITVSLFFKHIYYTVSKDLNHS